MPHDVISPRSGAVLLVVSAVTLSALIVVRRLLVNNKGAAASSSTVRLLSVDEFKDHFKDIASDLITTAQSVHELPVNEAGHLRRVMEYTVPGGKVNRGLTVVQVAQTLSCRPIENLRAVAALGWAVEWLQASFLVADDMMDSSLTRRGAPCWYLVPGIGTTAINDSLLLLTQCELLLDRYLTAHPNFAMMRRILLETIYQTELGQLMDLTTQPPGADKVNFELYTMDRYRHIVKYKTAFYSFVTPVRLGMLYAGLNDVDLHTRVTNVCLLMGEYFQIQDDVLDVYGAPEVIGKIGTDIQDAKCSWLVVTARSIASKEQLALLEANYGKHGAECIAKVKQVFSELRLEDKFEEYEKHTVQELGRMIAEIPNEKAQLVCRGLLNKIYKRDK